MAPISLLERRHKDLIVPCWQGRNGFPSLGNPFLFLPFSASGVPICLYDGDYEGLYL
jgi:hypothetical protein